MISQRGKALGPPRSARKERGIVFPPGTKGDRSTTSAGKAIFAAAVEAVDESAAIAVRKEKNWRFGYNKHIVNNAFPVTDVFDSLLISHLAKQRGPHQMYTLNHSVFAQVAKTGVSTRSLPKALRSQNYGSPVRVRASLKKKRSRAGSLP